MWSCSWSCCRSIERLKAIKFCSSVSLGKFLILFFLCGNNQDQQVTALHILTPAGLMPLNSPVLIHNFLKIPEMLTSSHQALIASRPWEALGMRLSSEFAGGNSNPGSA